jgi:5-methylcytosine-specific restriction endonuclease McrA
MPSERTIREHWAEAVWRQKGFDSRNEFMEMGVCFACGFSGEVHRAHIVPRIKGGSDSPDNLHMLCPFCHKDSEVMEGEEYMAWFFQRTPMDGLISRAARGGANIWSALQPTPEVKRER